MKKLLIFIFLFIYISYIFGQDKITTVKNDISATNTDSIQSVLDNYEHVELPPLSVFLASAYDHPSVQIFEAKRDEEQATLKDAQSKWLNYFRISGLYQYGQLAALNKNTDMESSMYAFDTKAQNQFNIGMVLSVPIGDLFGQKQKTRAQKARLRQIEYEYEISIEERKLKILEAYNQVVQQLAVLKAKSDAAALYNAQMKISEQDFINGKISIIDLSLERSRRSSAVVSYQEGRAALHNSITLLEMLTNVKIMNK
ncbi:TolC family protein [uncultured Parabacteroides sp.]|uniref:TolC family protein n=1 Tax=uncultured Parabacteroides sp. TaxID=512312 RepID=UPI0025831615|nr:TolC family protein [uncultured Parabacteroides sp.]